jgi:opacity protein-like surface antigen
MINLFRKCRLLALAATLSCVMHSNLTAWEEDYNLCESNRLYVGAFGGVLYPKSSEATQMGTALFLEEEGGPLTVQAEGRIKGKSTGFGGVQVGYEWLPAYSQCTDWFIAPAAELEAYFFSHKRRGHLINQTDTDRLSEHDFLDSFDIKSSTILANFIISMQGCSFSGLAPYIGAGIGATRVSIHKADSLQVAPLEAGINHFNAKRKDSSWAFTAQAKAGLRYQIFDSFHIFGEYRYVYVDSSNFVLGSTVYPVHAHTTSWNVKIDNMQYQAFAIGFQFDL